VLNLPIISHEDVAQADFYYDDKMLTILTIYMCNINWFHAFSFIISTEDYWQIFLTHLSHAVQLYVPVKKRLNPVLTIQETNIIRI